MGTKFWVEANDRAASLQDLFRRLLSNAGLEDRPVIVEGLRRRVEDGGLAELVRGLANAVVAGESAFTRIDPTSFILAMDADGYLVHRTFPEPSEYLYVSDIPYVDLVLDCQETGAFVEHYGVQNFDPDVLWLEKDPNRLELIRTHKVPLRRGDIIAKRRGDEIIDFEHTAPIKVLRYFGNVHFPYQVVLHRETGRYAGVLQDSQKAALLGSALEMLRIVGGDEGTEQLVELSGDRDASIAWEAFRTLYAWGSEQLPAAHARIKEHRSPSVRAAIQRYVG